MTVSRYSSALTRRSVLAGLAATPVAAGETIEFQTRQEATNSIVPNGNDHITVRGLDYVADPMGTALITKDRRRWSPHGQITPLHFGETSQDDTAIVQAAVDYAAILASRKTWDETWESAFPMQVVISGLNELYHVSKPIVFSGDNRSATIRDFSLQAIPGNWPMNGGEGRLGDEHYRPQQSGHVFEARKAATYLTFENIKINCNDLCGGFAVRAHSRVINCFVKKCGGVGVRCLAGDVWVDRCMIKQYDQNDVEFYDPGNYTGIGVLCAESDLRLTHSVVNWLAECVRIEGTNCNVAHCHIFNGCRRYLGAYKKNNGTVEKRKPRLNALLTEYFGFPVTDETNLPPRPYHPGIVVTGPLSIDNSFDSIYFDNCHIELYAHGVHFNEPKLGAKPNSSLWHSPVDYWFAAYPTQEGDVPQVVIDEVMMFVESRPKRLIAYKKHPKTGIDWAPEYRAINHSSYNLAESHWGDRFRLDVPSVHIVHQPDAHAKPSVTYDNPASGSSIGFTDGNSTRGTPFEDASKPVSSWKPGKPVRKGQRFHHKNRLYQNISPGRRQSGTVAPTHESGAKSDGNVVWSYLGQLDAIPVRFGNHGDNARISAPYGQVILGGVDAPVFRGTKPHALTVRTGDSGVKDKAPNGANDLTIESGTDGGMSIAIPNGGKALFNVATPGDSSRFQIEFDDATGKINFLVGGKLRKSF